MSAGPLPMLLGVAWGALASVPLARRARRAAVTERLPAHVSTPRSAVGERLAARLRGVRLGPVGSVIGALLTRRRAAREHAVLAHELPVTIDLLRVVVGAGCTPYLAVEVASRWAPPRMAALLVAVQHECALGAGFAPALDGLAERHPALAPLVNALLASERFGAPVGDALDRLAVEERAALRRRAEARARTVPVRLLFPLVFLVLPAFALLTVVPALLAGLSGS